MTSVDEFQKMFNERFPEGAHVTFLNSGNGDIASNSDYSTFTLYIWVLGVENEDPEISFTGEDNLRNYVMDLDEIHETDYGIYAITNKDNQPDLRISHRLTEAQREHFKRMGEGA